MLIAVNAGSSSLKLAVFDETATTRLFDGMVAEIGRGARLKANGVEVAHEAADHVAAMAAIADAMEAAGYGLEQAKGVGHRVVHGGQSFSAPARITPETRAEIERVAPLAPLHNPPALAAIDAMSAAAPELRQVACFDTAFHAGQPEVASAYALPADLRAQGFRRYGFHGLSYQSMVERLPGILGSALPSRLLALHLGNGASVAAIKDGRGVATSMGYSPLDGLTMGTRCGAIDAAVALKLAATHGPEEAERLLTRESGLKGLSGGVSDMRALEASGSPEAEFAIEHFCYWAARHSGSMIAAMGGVDLIAFTGGIGEHSPRCRETILAHLAWTGAPSVIVEADEEGFLARETARVLGGGE